MDKQYKSTLAHDDFLALRYQLPFVPLMTLPAWSVSGALVANVPMNITIPDGAFLAQFVSDGNVWVNLQGVAQIPAAGTLSDNGSMLDPQGYLVIRDVHSLSLIAGVATAFSLYFWPRIL